MKKILLNTILGFGIFIFMGFVSTSVKAGLGISPAQIDNLRLKPGTSFTEEIIISQSESDEDLIVTVEPDMKEANSWITFEPGATFTIPKGTTRFSLKIKVSPPIQTDLKAFNGVIRIKAASAEEAQAGGVSVVKGARVEVNLLTTNLDFADLIVRAISIDESQPADKIALKLKIENKGNIDASPTKVVLIVEDLNKNLIEQIETTDIEKIKAGSTSEVFAYLKSNLKEGEYFGRAQVYFDNDILREETLVFRISKAPTIINVVEVEENNSLVSKLSEDQTLFTAGSITFIGASLFISYWFIIKSEKFKNEQRRKIKISVFSLFIILSIVITLIINYDAANDLGTKGPEDSEEIEKDGEVKGIQTKSINNENLYFVYAENSTDSEIIYIAKEGESFNAVEEIDDWYRVLIGDGKFGWIPKDSIKKSN